MRCGWGFYFRGAFEAQAGNSPLQGQSKPPAKLVVLIACRNYLQGNRTQKRAAGAEEEFNGEADRGSL